MVNFELQTFYIYKGVGRMINHVGTKTLETKRLILRRYELSDAEDMFNNFANNENVSRFLSWYPHENVETTKNF